MKRLVIPERPDWRRRIEEQGLLFHALEDHREYWGEGRCYALTSHEVDALERATRDIYALCLEAAHEAVVHKRYAQLGVPPQAIPLVERAWHEEPPTLYGRLDFALGPDGVPKLLEFNADTPTSLLEASVIQWTWLQDCFPDRDQFNSIHEGLIATWRELAPRLGGPTVHFGGVESLEDEMTLGYLRDTATQAGLSTEGLYMEQIGWNGAFTDAHGQPIRSLFKLYPWEGLLADPFAAHLGEVGLTWIEPAWKMLWSTKGLLPLLWELFPGHKNLLPASFEPLEGPFVKKPLHGREGNNVTIAAEGVSISTSGPYEHEPFVYQRYTDLGEHDGMHPVVGSWLIGEEPAGIGIRETAGRVTDNTATFVPHFITDAT
jgi:glutathionylspermidine synthase